MSVNVVSTCVPIVVSVAVTVEATAGTSVESEIPWTASSIVSAPSCRLVDSSSSESCRLLPGLGVGLAEVLQVGREGLRRGLGVVDGGLHAVLRRIALEGAGGRRERGLPGRDRRADAARPGFGRGRVVAARAASRGCQRDTCDGRPENEQCRAFVVSSRPLFRPGVMPPGSIAFFCHGDYGDGEIGVPHTPGMKLQTRQVG